MNLSGTALLGHAPSRRGIERRFSFGIHQTVRKHYPIQQGYDPFDQTPPVGRVGECYVELPLRGSEKF